MSSTIELKLLNKERIRQSIKSFDKCTKLDIARDTGISLPACNYTLNELLENNEIIALEQAGSNGGRRAAQYAYNPEFEHIVLFYFDLEKSGCFVSNAMGEVVFEKEISDNNISIDLFTETIDKLLPRYNNVTAISVAIPGIVEDGCVISSDVKSLEGLQLEEEMAKRYDVKIIVERGLNFIAYGVNQMSETHADTAVAYFPPQFCVGCGFVIDGKVLQGNSSLTGEMYYAAEAFGQPLNQQEKAVKDDVDQITYAMQIAITIMTTVNPAEIYLISRDFHDGTREKIIEKCKTIIPEKSMPNISVEQSIFEPLERGLITRTFDNMKYEM